MRFFFFLYSNNAIGSIIAYLQNFNLRGENDKNDII